MELSQSAETSDIAGLTLGIDMPPSYVNNSIQEMMAQIKQWQSGVPTQPLTTGTLNVTGQLLVNGQPGTSGQVLESSGTGAPTWKDQFITGMIMLWSGNYDNIPAGWYLCNGGNGTPNLTDRFVIGSGSKYPPGMLLVELLIALLYPTLTLQPQP